MLPRGAESDRFLIAKDTKLVGRRSGKFVICYVLPAIGRHLTNFHFSRSLPFFHSFEKSHVPSS